MTPIIIEIFVLLIAFQLKQFVADHILQFNLIGYHKKYQEKEWVYPLTKHAFQHALGTFSIAVLYLGYCDLCPFSPKLYIIAVSALLFDFVVHFSIDRLKSSPNIGGKFPPSTRGYYIASGLDQMMHHFTHYTVIFMLIYLTKFH